LKFKYELTGTGWSTCEIKIEKNIRTFGASYLTDALGSFLNALLVINPIYAEEVYINNGAGFMFDNEPSGTEWHFKHLGNDKMLIEVTSYTDISFSEEPKLEIQTECSYDEFLLQVIKEAEKLLKEYGIVGYKKMWVEHEFPLSAYLKLKFYLDTKTKFPMECEKVRYKEIYKTNLAMELDYLSK
jgi:hypothetical protein